MVKLEPLYPNEKYRYLLNKQDAKEEDFFEMFDDMERKAVAEVKKHFESIKFDVNILTCFLDNKSVIEDNMRLKEKIRGLILEKAILPCV